MLSASDVNHVSNFSSQLEGLNPIISTSLPNQNTNNGTGLANIGGSMISTVGFIGPLGSNNNNFLNGIKSPISGMTNSNNNGKTSVKKGTNLNVA